MKSKKNKSLVAASAAMNRQSIPPLHGLMINPYNFISESTPRIVPPCFRTKCGLTWAGFIPGGQPAAGYFAVSLNALYNPFNSPLAAAARNINYYSGTPYNSSGGYNVIKPQGFSNICASTSTYQSYRVYSAKVKLLMLPQNSSDNVSVVMSTTVSGSQNSTSLYTAFENPTATAIKQFCYASPNRPIQKTWSIAELSGVDNETIRSSVDYGAFYNQAPSQECIAVILWNTVANVAFTNNVGLTLQVEYEVEFFEPATGALYDS
jgi:hypothetical protein